MKKSRILSLMMISALTVGMLPTGVAAEEEVETITVWTDQYHEKELRQKQIDEFNEGEGKELGIHIDYQVYGTNYTDTIRIAAQAGEAPELFHSDGKWLPEFVDAGWVIPIDDLTGSEELLNEYADMCYDQAQIFNGKTYTLPYSMTTYGFVINTDLFEEVGLTEEDYPKTWDDVRECAKIITEGTNGRAYGLGLSSTLWTVSSFYTFGAGQNIGHYGYDWATKQFDYSAYNPLIEAIDQMVADGSVFPGFETMDADAIRAQFAAGTIGMMGSASFDANVYTNNYPATCDWKVINIPMFSEDQTQYKRFGLATNYMCVGPKAMEHPEKTLKVLEFFYDDENTAEIYENAQYLPVRDEAIALATKEPEMKGWKEFAEFEELFVMPPVPDSYVTVEGTTYREAIVNMWTNPALDDVAAVMQDVDDRYNAALAEIDSEIIDLYKIPDGVSPVAGE